MKAFIKCISTYLPIETLDNKKISLDFPEWSVEKIALKTGINSRHIAAENEFASDMAIKSAELLFSEHNIKKEDIDFIILCTQSPDYLIPTTSCIVQDRLGLNKNIGAFDFNLGCSGYIYGLSIAKGLILSNVAKNILLITAESYSKIIHPKDKGNRTIFGDAATSTLVSTEGWGEIREFSFGTDGSGMDYLIHKNSGVKHRNKSSLENAPFDGELRNDDYLYMDGKAVFNFTADVVPELVDSVLRKNGEALPGIDLFIFHQANRYMLNFIRKKIGISEEKFFVDIEDIGNTVSSTIPIAIQRADGKGLIKNRKIILAGFGVGLSWGGVVING